MTRSTVGRPKKSSTLAKIEKENRELKKQIKAAEKQARKYETEGNARKRKIRVEKQRIIKALLNENSELAQELKEIESKSLIETKATGKFNEAVINLEKEIIKLSDVVTLRKDCLDDTKRLEIEDAENKKIELYEAGIEVVQETILQCQQTGQHSLKMYNFCGICGWEFTAGTERSPRYLDCGHTFCLSCIKRLAKPNAVICPFDEKVTLIAKSDLDKLKKNFIVSDMQ